MTAAEIARPTSRGVAASVTRRLRDWGPPALLLIGFLTAWELIVRGFGIKQFILPSPLAIATAWQTYLPELYAAARYTFLEIVAGLVIGATTGIVLYLVIVAIERVVIPWHASVRSTEP